MSIDRHLSTQTTGLRGTLSVYDNAGRVIESRRLDNLTITISELDALNHILTVGLILPEGVATPADLPYLSRSQTHYNALGQVDYTISATGQRTEYLYDDAGRQWKTIQIDVPVWNPTTGQNVATDLTTTTEFDGLGRAYRSIDANGHATETVYDDTGRVDRTVFHDGSFVAYGYDSLGRKVWQSDQLPAGSTQAAIDASKTSYEYDDSWNLTDVYLPAITDNKPGSPTFGQAVSPHWHYVYDRNGQQTAQTDPYGHTTSFAYNPLTGQRLSRTLPPDGDGNTADDTESWTYDNLGRQTTHTDFKGQVTELVYDDDVRVPTEDRKNLGRVAEERRYATPADFVAGTYAERTVYHYDALGRRDTVTITNASGQTIREEGSAYDTQNRLTRIATPEGVINYAYDDLGRKTRMWTQISATDPTILSDFTYGYDPLGRLQTVAATKLAGGSVNLTTSYAFDAVGNLDTVTLPNGVMTDYDYDSLNRLELETVTSGTETLRIFDYLLLPDGQRDYVIETDQAGGTVKIDWTYDADNRLIAEMRDEGNDAVQNGGDYTDTYTLDLVGNRLIKSHDAVGPSDDETITSAYSDRDQLLSEDSTNNGNDAIYAYDANGSQVAKTSNGVTTVYTWDLHNLLIAIDSDGNGTQDITYAYNSDGVRIMQSTVQGTTYFLIDPMNPTGYAKAVEERTDANADGQAETVATTYVLGMQVIAQKSGSDLLLLAHDGHGSTRLLLTVEGLIDQSFDYDAFGRLLSMAASLAKTNWLFGGDGIADKHAGLTYHLARWRDGERFVSSDPGWSYVSDPSSPATLHRYLYCFSDPIGAWDPSGEKVTLLEVLVVVFIALILVSIVLNIDPRLKTPRATNNHADAVIPVKIKPVYVTRKGKELPEKSKALLERELGVAKTYWKDKAGIELQWDGIQFDNSGKWDRVSIGYGDGNADYAVSAFYTGAPVIVYGTRIVDSHHQGTTGYTPRSVRKGIVVEAAGGETIAHELGHLFMDDDHHPVPLNLMSEGEDRDNVNHAVDDLYLTQDQVDWARNTVVDEQWGVVPTTQPTTRP
jgi:YD repeat-containing protein